MVAILHPQPLHQKPQRAVVKVKLLITPLKELPNLGSFFASISNYPVLSASEYKFNGDKTSLLH